MSAANRILKLLAHVDCILRSGRLTEDDYYAVHDRLEALRSRAAGDLTQKVLDKQLAHERAMRQALAEDKAARAADAIRPEVTE